MKQRSLLVAVVAIAMALALAVTCILYFASPGKNVIAEGSTQTSADETPADDPTDSDTEATAPTAVESYDFTSAEFDQSAWTKTGSQASTVSVSTGTGVSITRGDPTANSGYATENPLKGLVADGFSVLFIGTVTDIIWDYYSMFGFYSNNIDAGQIGSDPMLFFLAGTGVDPHLNVNGPGNSGSNYYDITGGDAQDMSSLSQLILTMDGSAINVYVNNVLARSIPWTDTWDAGAYSYETVDFINEAEYFALGLAAPYWGNAVMTAQQVSFYDTALTAEEIAAINASYADFTQLNALLDEAESFSVSNYDTTLEGWDAAYSAFTTAVTNAETLNFFSASQQEVNNAATALQSALDALVAFEKEPDITQGLVSAFPLNSTSLGTNIVTSSANDEDKVIFMNGNNTAGSMTYTEQLTADHFATYQGVSAAKLYEDEYLSSYNNDNPFADRGATSRTMGLDIPASAFSNVTTSTGLTITVNAYIENFYSGSWGRIFQLGDREMRRNDDNSYTYTGDGQIFVSVNGVAATDINGSTVMPNTTSVCSILARQWYSISIVLDPSAATISVYASGYQLNDEGAIEYMFNEYVHQTTAENVQTLFGCIISADAENWLGRSFWDFADTSVVGAVSNLSVYNRPLSATEIDMLHATSDLSTLVPTE